MTLTPDELTALLDRLIAEWESEVVEFKQASQQYDRDKTGQYVSALSNEANLRGASAGWLVFGVSNDRRVVGTAHLSDVEQRQTLKHEIHQSIDQGLTIREVHEVRHSDHRVVLLEIPPAPRGIPISWKGVYRARAGESLVPLSLDKVDAIRGQTLDADWSAVVVPDADLGHLDPAAITRARKGFAERHAHRIPAEEIDSWGDPTFLARTRLTRDGQITRAALLLLGADTSTHLLSPHPAEMTWKLVGEQPAYEHFRMPFLLTASQLAKRIRNVQLRLMPPDELIYREISKYDERSLLEAIYNCIAHQDYTKRSRIIVTEHTDRVEFISVGEFFDGAPEEYALEQRTPRDYRNPLLVAAMTELNLIDHMGYGIHRMVQDQVRRFLPLPDYDLDTPGEVKLTIPGAVIDESYSQLLMVRADLPLEDVLALDRVQKGLDISPEAVKRLRKVKLIEGRKPHLRVSASIADATGKLADYVRTRPQTDAHYATLLRDYLERNGESSRADIDDLLIPLLPEVLTDQQKRNRVSNLLAKLRREGSIVNVGSRGQPRWTLT
ncbi:RNA-binding domain-containing protein [Brevibacterium luteolum]|uniref:RNA-binding domain-containing protein n=1 Tax=Brevibacterium luteolum TaxID=199591 RepID=UPI00223C3307|nr:RNA-binding domain-containing protein [Brevibacterium luteolum]MCT1656863.1 putative DNA binding domain-containing protein [Brevibacterium luteolum]